MTLKVSFTCLFLMSGVLGFAQDDKKEWSKKLKSLDPMALKALYEERDQLKTEVETKNQEISGLNKQIEELKSGSGESNEKDVTAPAAEKEAAGTGGVIFKVQIGAFRNKDLTRYFENNKNFSGEVDSDGTKKYTLGYFSEYWEADTFKKYLREMGVKDAWIVPYKEGKRLNIKDVLEGVID